MITNGRVPCNVNLSPWLVEKLLDFSNLKMDTIYKNKLGGSQVDEYGWLRYLIMTAVVCLSIWFSRLEIAEFPDRVHRSAP